MDADRLLAGTISDDRANTHAHTSTTAGTTVTDDLTKGRIGLQTTAKATDAYGDRMEEFIHAVRRVWESIRDEMRGGMIFYGKNLSAHLGFVPRSIPMTVTYSTLVSTVILRCSRLDYFVSLSRSHSRSPDPSANPPLHFQELAKAAGQAELVQVDEEAEKREALSIPEHLQGPQTEETVLPGHWMTGMQEVGLSKEDQLRIIERTEAAKRELLGRAKELGVPDEEVVVRDTKISRKGIPKSFGDGKKKKKKYQVIASGE